jgi:hypothetical protein
MVTCQRQGGQPSCFLPAATKLQVVTSWTTSHQIGGSDTGQAKARSRWYQIVKMERSVIVIDVPDDLRYAVANACPSAKRTGTTSEVAVANERNAGLTLVAAASPASQDCRCLHYHLVFALSCSSFLQVAQVYPVLCAAEVTRYSVVVAKGFHLALSNTLGRPAFWLSQSSCD